jgi:hypothetical protein
LTRKGMRPADEGVAAVFLDGRGAHNGHFWLA